MLFARHIRYSTQTCYSLFNFYFQGTSSLTTVCTLCLHLTVCVAQHAWYRNVNLLQKETQRLKINVRNIGSLYLGWKSTWIWYQFKSSASTNTKWYMLIWKSKFRNMIAILFYTYIKILKRRILSMTILCIITACIFHPQYTWYYNIRKPIITANVHPQKRFIMDYVWLGNSHTFVMNAHYICCFLWRL